MTLVLLHALGVDATVFDDLRGRLDGIETLAPDLPGHGRTPALAAGAGVPEHAQWLATWLEEQEVGPVDLLGVSLGGLVAQQLAATRPDLVRRLVVVDAVATYPEPMRTMWRERAAGVRADGITAYVEPSLELWFTAALREAGDPLVTRVRELLEATPTEGYARACELLEAADVRAVLGQVTQPVLVVCGDDDAPPFRAAVTEFESAFPDVETCWIPGRHGALVESAPAALGPLTAFLARPTLENQS